MLQVGRVTAVQILEYAILVLKTAIRSLRGSLLYGSERSGLRAGGQSNARQSPRGGGRRRRGPGQHFCRSIIYKLFARSRTGIIRLGVGGVKAEIEKSEGVGGTPGRLREEVVVVVVKEKWKYSVLCN